MEHREFAQAILAIFGFRYDSYRIQGSSSTVVEENDMQNTIGIVYRIKKSSQ